MARQRRKITNTSISPIQIAGRWIQPGGIDTFDVEQLPSEWKNAGVAVDDQPAVKVPAMISPGSTALEVIRDSAQGVVISDGGLSWSPDLAGQMKLGKIGGPLSPDIPTITVSALNAATSSITNAQAIAYNNAAIRYFGARQMAAYSVYWGNESSTATSGTEIHRGFFMDFCTDAQTFEIRFNGDFASTTGLDYMMWVDGLPIASSLLKFAASAGKSIVKFAFFARRRRHIAILMDGLLHQLWIGPNDSIWASAKKLGSRIAFMGDSYTVGIQGSGVCSAIGAYMYRLGLSLGFNDIHCAGQATTGYANPAANASGKNVFSARVASEIGPIAPDWLFVVGSVNDDTGYSEAQITAGASAVFNSVAAVSPNTKIIVVGAQWPSSAAYAPRDANEAAVQAAVAAAPNVMRYISLKGAVTGTGNVGTTTGAGGGDIYTAADGVHPTQAGHDFLADWIFERCADLF